MEIVTKKLSELNGAEYNPRVSLKPGDPAFEKIAKSIEEFGYIDPIIVNRDGTIIGGHQRCEVLKALGHEEAQCVVVDFDKTQEKAANIALNKIAGQWDGEKLKGLFVDLTGLGADMKTTGFDELELKRTIGNVDLTKIAEQPKQFDEESTGASSSQVTRSTGKLPVIEQEISGGGEIDTEEFSDEQFDHQCPRCGFHFNE